MSIISFKAGSTVWTEPGSAAGGRCRCDGHVPDLSLQFVWRAQTRRWKLPCQATRHRPRCADPNIGGTRRAAPVVQMTAADRSEIGRADRIRLFDDQLAAVVEARRGAGKRECEQQPKQRKYRPLHRPGAGRGVWIAVSARAPSRLPISSSASNIANRASTLSATISRNGPHRSLFSDNDVANAASEVYPVEWSSASPSEASAGIQRWSTEPCGGEGGRRLRRSFVQLDRASATASGPAGNRSCPTRRSRHATPPRPRRTRSSPRPAARTPRRCAARKARTPRESALPCAVPRCS